MASTVIERTATFQSNVGGEEYSDFQGGPSPNAEAKFLLSGRLSTVPLPVPRTFGFSGMGNIELAFFPRVVYVVVFVRIRFSVGTGGATLAMRQLSKKGDEYGVEIFKETQRGTTKDVLYVRTWDEIRSGAWTFARDDGIKIVWTAPVSPYRYAVEIGIIVPLAM